MKSVKTFVMALVLGLSVVVYAADGSQASTESCCLTADSCVAGASCCTCRSCCATHEAK